MSASTIDHVITVPRAGAARSRRLVAVPAAARPSAPAVGHLRLTRRGRLTITLAVTVVVAVLLAAVAVTGARAAWAAPTSTPATATVTVLPGQTLWQIAGSTAPGDPRDAIIEIRRLNGLPDSQVFAGQVLTVPAG